AVRNERLRPRSAPSPADAAARAADAGATSSRGTWIYQPYPAPDFAMKDIDGREHSLAALAGRPAVVLFWATWAPPSRRALEELDRRRQAFGPSGTPVLAVSVDRPEDEPKVRAAAKGLGIPVMMAGEETASTYSIL